MVAGPPAAYTRSTRGGTSTRRPAPSTSARASAAWPAAGRRASTRPSSGGRSPHPPRPTATGSALAAHDRRRLDHGVGGVAGRQAQLLDRLVGDAGGDHVAAADVDTDPGRRGALRHLDDLPLEHVAGAEPHDDRPSGGSVAGRGRGHPGLGGSAPTWAGTPP